MKNVFKILENSIIRKVSLVGTLAFFIAIQGVHFIKLHDIKKAFKTLDSENISSIGKVYDLEFDINYLENKVKANPKWVAMSDQDKQNVISENKQLEKDITAEKTRIEEETMANQKKLYKDAQEEYEKADRMLKEETRMLKEEADRIAKEKRGLGYVK